MNPSNPIRSADIASVSHDEGVYVRDHWKILLLPLFVEIILAYYLINPSSFSGFVGFAMLAVALLTFSFLASKARKQFMAQVALALGWTYEEKGILQTVSGELFNVGHSQSLANVMTGSYEGMPIRIYNFQTTVGSGKDQHTYFYTIFEITYPYVLPHIILKNKSFFTVDEPPTFLSHDTSVTLEGDFSKYFTLRTDPGKEQEMFEVFTPDIMEKLIAKSKEISFEVFQSKLYLHHSGILTTKEKMADLYDTGVFLFDMLSAHFKEVKQI